MKTDINITGIHAANLFLNVIAYGLLRHPDARAVAVANSVWRGIAFDECPLHLSEDSKSLVIGNYTLVKTYCLDEEFDPATFLFQDTPFKEWPFGITPTSGITLVNFADRCLSSNPTLLDDAPELAPEYLKANHIEAIYRRLGGKPWEPAHPRQAGEVDEHHRHRVTEHNLPFAMLDIAVYATVLVYLMRLMRFNSYPVVHKGSRTEHLQLETPLEILPPPEVPNNAVVLTSLPVWERTSLNVEDFIEELDKGITSKDGNLSKMVWDRKIPITDSELNFSLNPLEYPGVPCC